MTGSSVVTSRAVGFAFQGLLPVAGFIIATICNRPTNGGLRGLSVMRPTIPNQAGMSPQATAFGNPRL